MIVKRIADVLRCQRPDRDEARLTCGYPLPCPWHTAVIDGANVRLPKSVVGISAVRALNRVASSLSETEPKS